MQFKPVGSTMSVTQRIVWCSLLYFLSIAQLPEGWAMKDGSTMSVTQRIVWSPDFFFFRLLHYMKAGRWRTGPPCQRLKGLWDLVIDSNWLLFFGCSITWRIGDVVQTGRVYHVGDSKDCVVLVTFFPGCSVTWRVCNAGRSTMSVTQSIVWSRDRF